MDRPQRRGAHGSSESEDPGEGDPGVELRSADYYIVSEEAFDTLDSLSLWSTILLSGSGIAGLFGAKFLAVGLFISGVILEYVKRRKREDLKEDAEPDGDITLMMKR